MIKDNIILKIKQDNTIKVFSNQRMSHCKYSANTELFYYVDT